MNRYKYQGYREVPFPTISSGEPKRPNSKAGEQGDAGACNPFCFIFHF